MDAKIYFEDEWAKRVTTEFAKNHPYPSFGEVQALLPLNLQLEYGEFEHAYCSEMYQNGFSDKELNQVCGKAIGMRGGFRAMQVSYYTCMIVVQSLLNAVSGEYIGHETPEEIRYMYKKLEYDWDGICGWKS